MENAQLPPELDPLKCILACGPQPAPSAALRQRVLAGVRSELHRQHRRSKWRLAAACAATLLMSLSLSVGAGEATSFVLQQRESPLSVNEVARRLRQLAPEISQEKSLHLAMLRHISVESGGSTALDHFLEEREFHDP
jgi:hypothetical protein